MHGAQLACLCASLLAMQVGLAAGLTALPSLTYHYSARTVASLRLSFEERKQDEDEEEFTDEEMEELFFNCAPASSDYEYAAHASARTHIRSACMAS